MKLTDPPPTPAVFAANMTLHDWYVGQAIIGLISQSASRYLNARDIARQAIGQADAVMELRNEWKGPR